MITNFDCEIRKCIRIRYYIMEEKAENIKENIPIAEQLKKINQIQKEITDLQAHIKFLLLKENQEEKKLTKLYDQSIKRTIKKIHHASEITHNKESKRRREKELSLKNNQVKEIREKELSLLKQTRLEIFKLKESQRTQLQQISKRNDERIRKMREQDKNKNQDRAVKIKKTHAEFVEQKKRQIELERRQKEEEEMKRSLMKIHSKPIMEIQIQKLKQQQLEISSRLERKKQIKSKLEESTRKITNLRNQQIIELTRNSKDELMMEKKQTQGCETSRLNQEFSKQLFKSAVRTIQTTSKEKKILLCR